MARPPRIPVLLPWECDTIYFMTLCLNPRQQVLANRSFFCVLKQTFLEMRKWNVFVAVVMPDHLHVIVSPVNRAISPADFSRLVKRKITVALKPSWRWQEGCFDHLVRSDESFNAKLLYVLLNPVRARLVKRWQDWEFLYSGNGVSTAGLEFLCN